MENKPGRPISTVPTRTLSVRIPEVALARLTQLAARRECTANYMARIIILRGLNQDYSLGTAMAVEEVAKKELSNIK